MAMGVFPTQTGGTFRRPVCPPSFLFCHSCPPASSPSSSRSFSATMSKSSRTLYSTYVNCGCQAHNLRHRKERFLNAPVGCHSLWLNARANYATMPLHESPGYNDAEQHSHSDLTLRNDRLHSIHPKQVICGHFIDLRKVVWVWETKFVNIQKTGHSPFTTNLAVPSRVQHTVNEQDNPVGLQDGSGFRERLNHSFEGMVREDPKGNLQTSLPPYEFDRKQMHDSGDENGYLNNSRTKQSSSTSTGLNGYKHDELHLGTCSVNKANKNAVASATVKEEIDVVPLGEHSRFNNSRTKQSSSTSIGLNGYKHGELHAGTCSVNRAQQNVTANAAVKEETDIVQLGEHSRSNNSRKKQSSLTRTGLKGHKHDELHPRASSVNTASKNSTSNAIVEEQTYIVPLDEEGRISDPGYVHKRLHSIYDKVLVVDDVSVAKEVVRKLTNEYRHLVHACDTEVAAIDVKRETPVGHGEIICFSIYSGGEADFGNGKSCIWVDVLDGGGRSLMDTFAPFFEDPSIKKVWHNYSFDNHIIENYGLQLSGFYADTMHMARLWDSSRRIAGGYSLEALTGDLKGIMSGTRLAPNEALIGKISMKTIFGKKKLKKDGSEGKISTIPPVDELQREERKSWICYSALDSISTLKLFESLKSKLSQREWKFNGVRKGTMFDFYEQYWRPFGELLVKMESEGMLVDRAYLAEIGKLATSEQQVAADRFRNWASKYCPDAKFMNVGSDTQLRQLFFGVLENSKDGDQSLLLEREFKVPNVDNVIEEGKKAPTKFRKIKLRTICSDLKTEMYTPSGKPSVSGDALKALAGKMSADYDFTDETLTELDEDDDDDVDSLEKKGKSIIPFNNGDTAYGTAYAAFGGGLEGHEACHAIAALVQVCSIDSLISNFILPLQDSDISGKNGRIHCSLNINTETGRLSARRPNLQNQPALEKDRYKIRQAFIAAPGNSLIVADYGQLELRILAHLADCKSMLDAFKAGGDFHSRTAMNMYPYIREAVDKREVLLEWHPQPGEDSPPVPLLKDKFGSERRKAKMLNFSIAYGKTAVGLSRDWKVSVNEARETVARWYSDRKEVLKWQDARKTEARSVNCVHTLLGRARLFPSTRHASQSHKNHIDRAAINTPVQGSAADVAMCAMLEISKNAKLRELGWKLLLQVHDEVILEGPTESAEVAKAIVVECMSKPFDGKNILKVDLAVDAKCAQNWYSAK